MPPDARRFWFPGGWWGDQGSTPQCVAYAWTHWLEDGPITQPGPGPIIQPQLLYDECQILDEWPGEDYEGTSVRAGAKALQTRSLIESYHWASASNPIPDLVDCLLYCGPVVVGTEWFEDMFNPGADGFLDVSGPSVGGHAYKLDGVNTKRAFFRIKNSWGRDWGNHGFAFVSFEDLERLLKNDGEACLAKEARAVV